MATYTVGGLYSPQMSTFPEGIHVINLSGKSAQVVIALNNPTAEQVTLFSAGRSTIEVGLATHQELLILLFRQRGVVNGWSDAPFDIRLLPPEQQIPPQAAPTLIQWVLVDAATGIIKGLRGATVSAAFMTQVRKGVLQQLGQPFDRARYDALVNEYQARFSPRELMKRAWRAERASRRIRKTQDPQGGHHRGAAILPGPTAALIRHRIEDERGLHYNWPVQVARQMKLLQDFQPGYHVNDPYEAMQDQFSTALHDAVPVMVDPGALTDMGPHDWDGRPLWLEFPEGRTYAGVAYEGALMFATLVNDFLVSFGVLMGRTVEQPLLTLIRGRLQDSLPQLPPGDPLRDVLLAITHVPMCPRPAPQHEPLAALNERLTHLLTRVRQQAPKTSAELPHLFLHKRHTGCPEVFMPSPLVSAQLILRDGLDEETALIHGPEVGLLTAWRFTRHVARIDESILADLRRAGPPQRLPLDLPGLTSHAVYIPVPGGLAHPHETGLFAGIDEVAGQRRLLMLIEIRAYGGVQLVPVSLALGTDLRAELEALTEEPNSTLTVAGVPAYLERLGLALQCVLHLGHPGTTWTGPGQPQFLRPEAGSAGELTLPEPEALKIWTVGPICPDPSTTTQVR